MRLLFILLIALAFAGTAVAEQVPETPVLTGPNFQQVPASDILVKPTGGAIQTLGDALAAHNDDVSSDVVTAAGTSTSRTLANRFADFVNVKDKGAKGDGVLYNGGAGTTSTNVTINASSTTLTVSGSLFASTDVGKSIVIGNAGTANTLGLPLTVAVTSAGSGYASVPTCTITDASGSGTGATCAAFMSLQTATLVSGGTGCVDGAAVEFIVGIDGQGTGTSVGTTPTVTGVVSGGVLSGPLTITRPGFQTTLGTLTAAPAYGDSCATNPTITLSYGVGAIQVTGRGAGFSVNTGTYSMTQTTAALSGGSPSVAAVVGAVGVYHPTPPLITTIAAYVSPVQVTLVAPAASTLSAAAVPLMWATDDHAAFQTAINAGTGIFIPAGIYWNGANILEPGTKNLIVMGAGRDNTIIMLDTGNSTTQDSPTPGAWTPWMRHTGGVKAPPGNGQLTFQDFQVRGLLDFGRVDIGAGVFELNRYSRISQVDMIFRQMPFISNQLENIGQYEVKGTLFDTSMRDGARCRACQSVRIIGNKFIHSDDDSVALHQNFTSNGAGEVGEDFVVMGNDFEDTMCVHILSARNAVIQGNTFRRCKIRAIDMSWTFGEGSQQLRSLTVADNIMADTVNRIGDGPSVCVICISYSGPVAPNGVTSMFVGVPATVNFVPKPWDYDRNYTTGLTNGGPTTQFSASARGMNIHDNTITRTLPAVANYSAWKFGQFFSPAGFIDPPMVDSFLQPSAGISTSVNALDLSVHDNHVQDVRRGIVVNDAVVIPGIIHVSVNNNHIYNAWEYGIYGPGSGAVASFDIIGNSIDLDPYLISPGRAGTNGSWTSGYTASVGVSILYTGRIKLGVNAMQNMYTTQQPTGSWMAWNNTLRGSPFYTSGSTTQIGWTSSNLGIGAYPNNGGGQFDIQPVVSNPGSAPLTWGLNLVGKTLSAAAAPSSGFHVVGDFIISTAPQTCTCTGWVALNTGTTWTSGTDYKVVPIQ
jgi:hypothetical protein